MKIQLNSDNNIQISEKLEAFVTEKLNHALKRFEDRITRIEVYLSDQNARKESPDDVQCKIEARIKDLQPVIVTGKNNSKEKALNDAINKMKAALDKITGRQRSK
ncbi:MAG TPA: ribosome-associated translation inhibitor RaiA [Bacteroidales bacterium]|jgi:ribosomal subunit interface protein|nr:ribosome-associated translation inhibitor RaiA [Bacteroidota bacterium]HPI68250.1 ribosome-associated translation inhibitor RaiA [Bacteroidales bacterium]HPR73329.1 ribosome-associated translation inhibitor RaiA [Bacteroidales bacterium]